MPQTAVYFYAEVDGEAPVLQWLDGIAHNPQDKLFRRVQRLEELGHELRRPEAAPLRDGIYELRVRSGNVNYRLLYFFHHHNAIIAHGCTKEAGVDAADIDRALRRKKAYEADPQRHRYQPPDG
jgi:putative component of toxin-antitoxin plasmid stabilization module